MSKAHQQPDPEKQQEASSLEAELIAAREKIAALESRLAEMTALVDRQAGAVAATPADGIVAGEAFAALADKVAHLEDVVRRIGILVHKGAVRVAIMDGTLARRDGPSS